MDRCKEWVAPVEDTLNVAKQTMAMVHQPQEAQGYQMSLKPGVWLKRRIVKVTYPGEGIDPVKDLEPFDSNKDMLKGLTPRQTKSSGNKTKSVEGGQTDVGHSMLELVKSYMDEATLAIYKLTSELRAWSSIIVEGVVNDDVKMITVGFWIVKESSPPTYAFEFTAWFESPSYTYLDSFFGDSSFGDLRHREVKVDGKFPFRRGQPFYIEFYITEAEFKVAVDGQHYTSYKHRVPFKYINELYVFGRITLTNVSFQNNPKYPSPLPQGVWIREEDYNEEQHGEIIIKDANVPVPEPAWSSAI